MRHRAQLSSKVHGSRACPEEERLQGQRLRHCEDVQFHAAEKESGRVCRPQGEGGGQARILAVGLAARKQLLDVLRILGSARVKGYAGAQLN
ncbi:hypothetical protein DUI87_26874 [Hirundo rustica rustica]|uniref:Uncharacterized protein n=1 Tax=Hirundo rustica rustica TaxID=333673 RepID=A0A3M0J6S6_HIRRU|nr:hypothetical protein DUI87_26874 [Hirundo rustica rustica]